MDTPDPRTDAPLDQRVLLALADAAGHRGFSGLRRALGAHPESLVRSLRRLERYGEIGRDTQGYFLKNRGDAAPAPGRFHTLASVRVPSPLDPEAVLGALAGRWFGGLRWVGTYDDRRPPALVWSVPGVEGLLVLRLRSGQLRLEAELAPGHGVSPELAAAGDELLWNALGRLRGGYLDPAQRAGGRRPGSVSFGRSEPAAPRWAS